MSVYVPFFHDIAKREVAYRSDSAAAIKEWPEPDRSHTAARGPVRTLVWGISVIQYMMSSEFRNGNIVSRTLLHFFPFFFISKKYISSHRPIHRQE